MKASTTKATKPAAAQYADDNMETLINNVEPTIDWINFAAKLAVSGAYGYLIGTCFGMLVSSLLAATSSLFLITLGAAVLLASMIFVLATTTQLVANIVVDVLPAATGVAYGIAKNKATSLLGNATSWFAAKRASYSAA